MLQLLKIRCKQNRKLSAIDWESYYNQLKPIFFLMKVFGILPMEMSETGNKIPSYYWVGINSEDI